MKSEKILQQGKTIVKQAEKKRGIEKTKNYKDPPFLKACGGSERSPRYCGQAEKKRKTKIGIRREEKKEKTK